MRSALGGPRLLLRRLREAMAQPVSAQARLDSIVMQIASNMVAEVCSVYVLRADGYLELYATEGLNRESVHLTTLKSGEGLVGLIAESAEPLTLSDAQSHPAFSFKPETGEEIYHSFLGVPILRSGNTLGVLVVQNRTSRSYSEEEVEALETTAMLLAEMVASGELQSIAPRDTDIAVLRKPLSLYGIAIAEGVGLGHAVLHEPRIIVKQLIAEDEATEVRRLDQAIEALRESVDRLVARGEHMGQGEHRDVLETFRMFANDRGWLRRLREAVATGLTAEAAVEKVQNDARARLQRQTDPYLRERLHDLDDLANRLLHQLTGQGFAATKVDLPENAIVIARTMGPAALLEYERASLRGLVLEDGGASSHVAIVARALGIPVVGDVANITRQVEAGDAIIIDGGEGEVYVRPMPNVEQALAEKARLRARRQEQYHALRDRPAITLDGARIGLHMNAGLQIDVQNVAASGAESIGLFRTELQFMLASRFPRLEQQYHLYKAVLDALPDRPVTFRTLDIGSDKVLPYMSKLQEENPALGWRAIRIGLDRPALLRTQLRALLWAGGGRDLRIMFPMVTTTSEFERAAAMVERERLFLGRHEHQPPKSIELGVMIEVPSLLWELNEICARAAFLSVGSNDLAQYLFAADRDNKRLAGRFDILSPAALRALKSIADAAARHGVSLSLCGEMGGRPIEALALIALGYRHLSMSPACIGPVKAMVLALDAREAAEHMEIWLSGQNGASSLRDAIRVFAEERGVPL